MEPRRWVGIAHWVPRILCILAIMFLSLFSLDVFNGRSTVGEQIVGFLVHSIPSFVLALILAIAWKWEMVGGSIFVVIGLAFSPFVYVHNYRMNHSVVMSLLIILTITCPFILTGVLFILSRFLKRKAQVSA